MGGEHAPFTHLNGDGGPVPPLGGVEGGSLIRPVWSWRVLAWKGTCQKATSTWFVKALFLSMSAREARHL